MTNLEHLRDKALKANIPIMQETGILFCQEFIKENRVESILEIGTAIGYWSLCMASVDPNLHITSIEFDEVRHQEAVQNILQADKSDQIECVCMDAKLYKPKQMYDLIFLDGPKAQNKAYFNQFIYALNPKGCVIVDNMDFHGHVGNMDNLSERRNLQQMVQKIAHFKVWITNHPDYVVMQQDVGDGLLVIWRKYPDVLRYDMISKGDSI